MEIVLHLGPHKTASTYLQKLLEQNIVPLEHHRIGFVCPNTLRPMFAIAPRRRLTTPRTARKEARAWALRQTIDTASDLQRQKLIISEEQLIGSLRRLFIGKGLYRDVSAELRGVAAALNGRPVKVLFALRSYETFLISAYGQVLSGWKYVRFTQELRNHLLRETRGWPELLADVMQALPGGSTLRVWQYETFRQQESDVLAAFVGEDAVEDLKPLGKTPRLGPSTEGIRALDQMAEAGASPDIETIRRTLREHGKDRGFSGYDPWTDAERSKLQERYARDIDLIRSLWPGALLETPVGLLGSAPESFAAINPVRRPGFPITNLQKQTAYRRPVVDSF